MMTTDATRCMICSRPTVRVFRCNHGLCEICKEEVLERYHRYQCPRCQKSSDQKSSLISSEGYERSDFLIRKFTGLIPSRSTTVAGGDLMRCSGFRRQKSIIPIGAVADFRSEQPLYARHKPEIPAPSHDTVSGVGVGMDDIMSISDACRQPSRSRECIDSTNQQTPSHDHQGVRGPRSRRRDPLTLHATVVSPAGAYSPPFKEKAIHFKVPPQVAKPIRTRATDHCIGARSCVRGIDQLYQCRGRIHADPRAVVRPRSHGFLR